MPAEEFRRRMHDDVSPMFNRAQEIGRCKGIVNDDGKPVPMCNVRDGFNINQVCIRIPDGFDINALGIFPNGILKCLKARLWVHKAHADAPIFHGVGKEVERAAIDGLLGNDVIPHMGEALYRRCNGGCS